MGIEQDKFSFERRSSGILVHPSSLSGDHGIGDLGNPAYKFVNFLAESKQKIWQILPLGPTGYGNSPYLCYSAIAGNPILISLNLLEEAGWLSPEDFTQNPKPNFPIDYVDFDLVGPYKMALLERAYENFIVSRSSEEKELFELFCQQQASWLDDYALFMSLKQAHDGASWYQWDREIATRDQLAISNWREKLASSISYHQFLQYVFFQQWSLLKSYANERDILIFGDIPIYVAHDSADVWASPENFLLDSQTGLVKLMAGVPPDYFSETGQLWGNPVYNWENLETTGFSWWLERIEKIFTLVDLVRIDHFRGFEAFWAVPQGEKTAQHGQWIKAPGEEFFTILRDKLGQLPIVAEDLGVITPEVEKLRDDFSLPGMKILQFAFGSDSANPFLPYNLNNQRCVIYTGTHDNDTAVGWFESLSNWERTRVIDYLGYISSRGIHWQLIRLAMSSVANIAIFPLQDILGLGAHARMNTPGIADGNWTWRCKPDALYSELAENLAHLTDLYGRY